MKKIFYGLITVSIIISLILTGCATNEESSNSEEKKVIELKMGTKMPPESIEGQGFQKFADLVAEKTNNEVIVNVFPSEQLGDTATQVDNLALGTQDIYAEGLAYFKSYVPELGIESLPYIFTGRENYQEILESGYGELVAEKFEDKGFVLLDPKRNFIRGPYRVMCSTFLIESLEDIQGLRMRSHDNAQYMAAYNELGANPLVIAWSETYLSLKQGTIDAMCSPISLVYDMSFTEVAPYVAIIDEYPQNVGFVMNKEKFDSLTEPQQKAVKEACVEAGKWATEKTLAEIDLLKEKMKEEHNAVFTEIDTNPFREKLIDFYVKLEEEQDFGTISLKDITK